MENIYWKTIEKQDKIIKETASLLTQILDDHGEYVKETMLQVNKTNFRNGILTGFLGCLILILLIIFVFDIKIG